MSKDNRDKLQIFLPTISTIVSPTKFKINKGLSKFFTNIYDLVLISQTISWSLKLTAAKKRQSLENITDLTPYLSPENFATG